MKITGISNDELLREELYKFEKEFSFIYWIKEDDNESKYKDALILDQEVVPFEDLKGFQERYDCPILYRFNSSNDSSKLKNYVTICKSYNVEPILPGTLHSQIQHMKQYLFKETKRKKVMGFFGTHSGSGVSTTVLNVAKLLSESVSESVVVLSLNPHDPSDYFYNYQGRHLNDLYTDLLVHANPRDKFMESLSPVHGFHHLAGNRDIKKQRTYNVDAISKLIDIAQETFDVVLIDSGVHFDNACYATSFLRSDTKFLVTTQEEKGYRGYFPHIFEQVLKPLGITPQDFLLVINKYSESLSPVKSKDIESDLDMSLLGIITDMQSLGNIAIAEEKFLVDVAPSQYKKEIQKIANAIIVESELNALMNDVKESKGLFGLFFKKGSVNAS